MTKITITGASVWDGVSDAAYPVTVTIDGNKIINVAEGEDGPANTEGDIIDGSGHTLMPGMVEGHCHPSFTGINEPPELGLLSNKEHMLLTAQNLHLLLNH